MKEIFKSVSTQVLPFQSRFVSVAGYRMHYIDEGSGPVVLCLHGNPTWSFLYRNVIRELRGTFRVIAPDFLGCGLSDRTPGTRYKAIDRINQLEEFVSALGLTKFSMVMHDWGGPLGTGFLMRRLDSIERIVYLNTTLTETESLPPIIKLAAMPVVGKALTRHTPTFVKLTTSMGAYTKLNPDIVAGYMAPYTTRQQREAIWDFVADIPFDASHPTYSQMVEIAAGLPKVALKPIKIIWGLRDPCFHREMLSKVAAHFPQAEILEIGEASHLVLDDAPQIAIPAIKEFLSRSNLSEGGLSGRGLSGTSLSGPAGAKTPQGVTERREIERGATEATPSTVSTSGREEGSIHVIYDQVMRIAEEQPTLSAVITPRWVRDPINGSALHYATTTYADLAKLVNQYQRGLADAGLAPGDRVLMLVSPGADFLALSVAIAGRGATPVFVDPGIGLERLSKCIHDASPHAFIGSPKAQILRHLKRGLFQRLKFYVTAAEWAFSRGKSLGHFKRFANAPIAPVPLPVLQADGSLKANNAALIAFTSGATGTPKGVIFTNEMLAAELNLIRDTLGQRAGGRDLTLLPIFSLFNVALGVASVFPTIPVGKPLALDPSQVVKLINDLGIDSSFGSPTLWNKIAEYTFRTGQTLPTMKRVFMAGAAVASATISRVRGVLPNATVATPYGATESLPVTYISAEELDSTERQPATTGEQGTLVGKAVPGIEIRIIKSFLDAIPSIGETQVLPTGAIGEVIVSGANCSPEYLRRPDANRLGKIVDGDRFWHRMGDLGYLDGSGNLYYCGRKSHSVYTAERAFHSVPIEEIFNQLPKVRRTALVGIHSGREPALVVEPLPEFWPETPEQESIFREELRRLAAQSPLTASIGTFFFHRSFPVDARHNAKIFREELQEWAEKLLVEGHSATERAA